MSDEHVPTPRTDAEAIPLNDQCVLVSYDFARTLERELAAATARAESLSAVITEITPTILNGRGGWTIGEIAPAVFALYARAEKAEAELTRYVDAVNAQPWASDLPIRKLLDEITSRLYQAESRVRHVETGFARMQEIAERAGENLAAAEAREGNANARIVELEALKDGAYSERNKLVAALSKLFPSSIEEHDGRDWEAAWGNVVYIDLPTGQVSWHIHYRELPLFSHLNRGEGRKWDGHTTEEKYRRLAALARVAQEGCAK